MQKIIGMIRVKSSIFIISFMACTLAIFNSFSAKSAFAYDSSNAKRLQNIIESNPRYYTAESNFGGRNILQFFNNYTYHSSDKNNQFNENYIKDELYTDLKINKYFSVTTLLKLEPVTPRTASAPDGHNKSFEDEAGFVDELTLNYDRDNFSLLFGKFNLDFGRGYIWQNGIWNSDLAQQNYEFAGKIGGSGIVRGGNRKTVGEYVLNISSFVNDTKYLNNSIFTKRDTNSKSDATPGDDRGLGSYSSSLNIFYDFGNKEELSYHFSYLNLAVNKQQSQLPAQRIADQKGLALNMNYKYPICPNLLIDGFVEYVSLKNFAGDADLENNFLTTNLIFHLYQNWSVTASSVQKTSHQTGFTSATTRINELSFGYKFDQNSILDGLNILLGVKENKVDDNFAASMPGNNNGNTRNSAVGFMARYIKKF